MQTINQSRRIFRYAFCLMFSFALIGTAQADLGPNLSLTGPGAGADGTGFSNAKTVRDGDLGTASQANGTTNQRIAVKWNAAITFDTVILREQGNNVTSWELTDHSTGQVLANGSTIGPEQVVYLGSVNIQKINLWVRNASSPPALAEFEVYNTEGAGASSSSSEASSSSAPPASSSSEASSSSVPPVSSSSSSSSVSPGNVDFSLVGYATGTGDAVRSGRGSVSTTGVTGGAGDNPSVVTYRAANNELRDALRSGNYAGGMIFYVADSDWLDEILLENRRHQRTGDTYGPFPPITIYVTDTLTVTSNTNHFRIEGQSNVSIIGDGGNGELNGIGIRIIDGSNVIIRNLQIHHVDSYERTGIEIAYSNNIWIDRNELFSAGLFYNSDGSLDDRSAVKDYYDGLLDIKHGSNHITVSWNVFRDHYKGLLLGHADNANAAPDNITYHHNHFLRLNTRVPLIRFATTHMFNNVFEDIATSAVNSRMGALVRVENNHFDNVGSGNVDSQGGHVQGPVGWWYGSNTSGHWDVIDNTVIDSPTDEMQSTISTDEPFYFYRHVMQNADDARNLVVQHAGRSFEAAP